MGVIDGEVEKFKEWCKDVFEDERAGIKLDDKTSVVLIYVVSHEKYLKYMSGNCKYN